MVLYKHFFKNKIDISWDGDWDEALRPVIAVWNELKILPDWDSNKLAEIVATCKESEIRETLKMILHGVANKQPVKIPKDFNGTAV
jgi:hypothetical protein